MNFEKFNEFFVDRVADANYILTSSFVSFARTLSQSEFAAITK